MNATGTVAAVVSAWEYECCGEPLFVGATGDFTLVPEVGSTSLPPIESGTPVSWRIERHVISGSPLHLRARVVGLWEWTRGPETSTYAPLERMRIIDGWRPGTSAGSPGWIVALRILEELTPVDDAEPYDGISPWRVLRVADRPPAAQFDASDTTRLMAVATTPTPRA